MDSGTRASFSMHRRLFEPSCSERHELDPFNSIDIAGQSFGLWTCRLPRAKTKHRSPHINQIISQSITYRSRPVKEAMSQGGRSSHTRPMRRIRLAWAASPVNSCCGERGLIRRLVV